MSMIILHIHTYLALAHMCPIWTQKQAARRRPVQLNKEISYAAQNLPGIHLGCSQSKLPKKD